MDSFTDLKAAKCITPAILDLCRSSIVAYLASTDLIAGLR